MSAIALLLALAAFGAFGLASDGHYTRVTGRRPSTSARKRWQTVAWLALALSAASSIMARGWAFGPVWWLGVIMFAAGMAFLVLNLSKSS